MPPVNPHSIVARAGAQGGSITGISDGGVFDPTEFDAKTDPVVADKVVIQDTEASDAPKVTTITNLAKPIGEIVAGTNATSGLSEVDGVCRVNISGVADKTAPVAADSLLMNDSENGNINKEVTAANLCKALAGTLAGVEATNGLKSSAGVLTVAAKIAHLEAALLKGTTVIPMSFETGEQMALKVYFNHKVTIDKIRGIVTTAIAGTDDGTITAANGDGDMATGVLTATAGDPPATEYSAIPTTNNVIAQDGYVSLTSAKETVGGRMLVTLEWTRTA